MSIRVSDSPGARAHGVSDPLEADEEEVDGQREQHREDGAEDDLRREERLDPLGEELTEPPNDRP